MKYKKAIGIATVTKLIISGVFAFYLFEEGCYQRFNPIEIKEESRLENNIKDTNSKQIESNRIEYRE